MVGHLRTHRTETGEPVPGAPTFTHHARLKPPTQPSHFQASHGPIRPHSHPRTPAVYHRRLHRAITSSPTSTSPPINLTHLKHPTAAVSVTTRQKSERYGTSG
ncbi:hypothetical protein SprV_0301137800 [Sparganum proliferum]